MQTNISTLDINETTLSFVYSLVNLIGSGEFSVEVNNNEGSGDVVIFLDTTNNVITDFEQIALPASMDNKSSVSITVICDIASTFKPTRQCFVDDIKLNGTAITNTVINISGFDSIIAFGDGFTQVDGHPLNGLFYSAQNDTVGISGNVFIDKLQGTYTGGSAFVCVYNNGTLFSSEVLCP